MKKPAITGWQAARAKERTIVSIDYDSHIGELVIDDVFSSLAPALTEEERNLLEESILEDGCRDYLIAWQEERDGKVILVDGHNRHEICTRVGTGFRVRKMHFADREAVIKLST
jgi:hypothetical protein